MRQLYHVLLSKSLKEKLRRARKQIRNFQILYRDYAQWTTVRDWDCIDAGGREIPWYTYPAIEYLSHIDFSDLNVFEFGSGNSTIWWTLFAKSVVSIESDPVWYDRIKSKINNNESKAIYYELITDEHLYVESLGKIFDIVIIDGKNRSECVNKYISLCGEKKGGVMLIFDNSDWYPLSINKLRQQLNWVELDFHGFGPINNYTWSTTVFINPEFRNRINYKKVLEPISGLKKNIEDCK